MTKGISTAGMTLGYIIASASAIPTSGSLTIIPEVKTMPNLNVAPENIDITTLNEEEYRQYTAGLKDIGILEFGANLTDELITAWNTTLMAAIAGATSGSVCWFCIEHPKLTQAVWLIGEPSKLLINDVSVGAALETTLYIAPKNAPAFGAKL